PELVSADAELDADAAALAALSDWCVRFSPAVALDPPDGLFLDITGVDHLWGGEAAMLADFTARLAAGGIPVRCAVADTPGAAWALARFGEAGAIAAPEEQATRLGLATIGRLAALPRNQVTRRFGPQAVLRLDQALGALAEGLAYRRPPSPWFARLAFAEPISAPEDLARVSADIAQALCAQLETRGYGACR